MKKLSLAIFWFIIPFFAHAQYQTPVTILPVAQGGASIYRNIDLDEAKVAISATPAQIYGWYLFNAAASPNVRYFKFYNATSANTTVGTTAPFMTVPVPSGAGANVSFAEGIQFTNAITAACVTGVADNSTGAPGTNDCIVDILYKN